MRKTIIIIALVLLFISGVAGYHFYSVYTNYNYDISPLSDDEVVNECMKILDSQIYSNPPLSQYYATFKEPLEIVEDGEKDKVVLEYYKNQNIVPKHDVINSVTTSYNKELNGEVYFRNTNALDSITVRMTIFDYERATIVFNKLAEDLTPFFSDVTINDTGTQWSANGLIEGFSEGDAGDLMGVARKDFVTISKVDNYYVITASTYTGTYIANMYKNVYPKN